MRRDVERLVELLLGEVAALDVAQLETTSRIVFSSASACLATLAAFS